jgi:type II secretory pathway component PulM
MLDKISAFWNTLSRRDRRLMVVMVTAITLFVGYFVVTGIRSRVNRLETTVATKERDLDTLQTMLGSLEDNRAAIADLEEQLAGYSDFSVSGFLESTGEELKISDNIKGINDQGASEGEYFAEHRYEVVMKKVTLEQLVNYLYKIHSAPQPLRIDKLQVRANTRNREELNVNVDVVFSKLSEEG